MKIKSIIQLLIPFISAVIEIIAFYLLILILSIIDWILFEFLALDGLHFLENILVGLMDFLDIFGGYADVASWVFTIILWICLIAFLEIWATTNMEEDK